MLDFPASPTLNQIFTAPNGTTWMWDGAKWVSTSAGTGFLPLTGGTMVGDIVLAHDPPAALNPATKQYVDATNIRYKNRIINGDMSVDQRNGGTQIPMPAANSYIIDRWKFNNPSGVASKGNVGRLSIGDLTTATKFPYCMNFSVTTAYAPAAADKIQLMHFIENVNFKDAQWGTASAQLVVLEFWVFASVAGTYAFALGDTAGTRSYVTTVSLAATTWTKIRLNIPGDVGGSNWSVADNASALVLYFPLCVGSTHQTSTLNAWQAGEFESTAGAVNVLATNGGTLNITGVALMVGAAAANAEPEFKKYSDNLIDCKRYYQIGTDWLFGYSQAGSTFGYQQSLPMTPRAAPTIVLSGQAYNNASGLTASSTSNGIIFYATCGSAGACQFNSNWTADADF